VLTGDHYAAPRSPEDVEKGPLTGADHRIAATRQRIGPPIDDCRLPDETHLGHRPSQTTHRVAHECLHPRPRIGKASDGVPYRAAGGETGPIPGRDVSVLTAKQRRGRRRRVQIKTGHAFKFASLLGRILVDLAIDGAADVGISTTIVTSIRPSHIRTWMPISNT